MKVNNTPGDVARTDAVQRAQQAATPAPATTEAPAAIHRIDAVQISDAGRALSGPGAGGDVGANGAAAESVDPRRADEIRTRVLSGAYNSVEMADQVARSILRSGDL